MNYICYHSLSSYPEVYKMFSCQCAGTVSCELHNGPKVLRRAMIHQCSFLPDAHVALICSECRADDSIFSRKEIKIKHVKYTMSNFNIPIKVRNENYLKDFTYRCTACGPYSRLWLTTIRWTAFIISRFKRIDPSISGSHRGWVTA